MQAPILVFLTLLLAGAATALQGPTNARLVTAAGSPLNAIFVSDAEPLVAASGARLWIHGHTHDSFDYQVQGTRVLCNPRGYAKDGNDENPLFDPRLVVEVA